MNATAERYEDDLSFWTALRGHLFEFVDEHQRVHERARRALGFPSNEPAIDRKRQPYDLPARPRARRRVRLRYGDTVESEAEAMARFRTEATRLAEHDADVAAIVAAYEEGGEVGADPEMVAVIADLDEARYAAAMLKLAALMNEIAEDWMHN